MFYNEVQPNQHVTGMSKTMKNWKKIGRAITPDPDQVPKKQEKLEKQTKHCKKQAKTRKKIDQL